MTDLQKTIEKFNFCKHNNDRRLRECLECKKDDDAKKLMEKKDKDERHKRYLSYLKNNIETLLYGSGVPKRYLNKSYENYKGTKIVEECKKYTLKLSDDNLLISGKTGCGKTHLAVAILRDLIINNNPLAVNKAILNIAKFINLSEFFLELREIFRDKSTKTETEIINKYTDVPLLIIDDLGSEKTSEYTITTLYIIINKRLNEIKPTIITTNYSIKDIEHKINSRVSSRLSTYKNISINLPDYRKNHHEKI